jgi:serine/threonine protein kinase
VPELPSRQAGQEPLPGYRLLEQLGRGGFGEVWKCVVSGGLHKAIKFVSGKTRHTTASRSAAEQELEALKFLMAVRHPFILSIERVEHVDGSLVIVMELADKNLQAVLLDHEIAGLPGIPRPLLLNYLREAAEALDVMNFQHGLQHLDVKPHNLFVIGNHIKVGDFGLVHQVGAPGSYHSGGLTPLYAAPELYRQSLSRHSDQYSLAIVYQQMLTGTVPFPSPDPQQLRMQHLTANPDLSALPVHDRAVVGRALSKDPQKRFASCQEFVSALTDGAHAGLSSQAARQVLLTKVRQKLQELDRVSRSSVRPASSLALPCDTPVALTPPDAAAHAPVGPAQPPAPKPRSGVHSLLRRAGEQAEGLASSQLYQRTCVVVPGYRFLECRGQNPLGELWLMEDNRGRQRLGFSLIPLADSQAKRLTEVVTAGHPALPQTDVFWSPAGRLVLVMEPGRRTLRDQFEECQKQGRPGIPRSQLLAWMRAAAEALDQLAAQHGLWHLGLNPGNLLLEGERLLIGDFGLVPLVWMPGGQSAGQVNPRYAGPELVRDGATAYSDQYSLALIYAEMVTGFYPRLKQPNARSGFHRRPPAAVTRSGPPVVPHKVLDLDFLPAEDHAVVARALHDDPFHRFASCTAFVEALEHATLGGALVVPRNSEEI